MISSYYFCSLFLTASYLAAFFIDLVNLAIREYNSTVYSFNPIAKACKNKYLLEGLVILL